MARRSNQVQKRKEVRAWGVRRKEVDIHQLALAYYLLARIRREQRRQAEDAQIDQRSSTEQEAA